MIASLPQDYAERVYAGVLGKIIGVYLGRPVEGWRRERIAELVGEIGYYVNDRADIALKNHLLVVPDDDITGTLTFARPLRDDDVDTIDAQRVAAAWLNYIVPMRTVLWWGGVGMSTEHTAYLHMRDGMIAPTTGSAATNGTAVAEQVGGQIFVEAWALANPGDPERAAGLAQLAASVSHDGEALAAARVIAALVAQAFVEDDLDKLLDTAQSLISSGSLIHRVIDDVRSWYRDDIDWREGFARIDEKYGYHRYPGNCHVVPNHAVIINALLHGRGDFTDSLGILTSCGWDTDSNGGNLGCIVGVLGGLAGIDAGPDWRGPVADRLYLPTADAGGAITDAAREALSIVGYARALRHEPAPLPKDGARFHFSLPGSVQGFRAEPTGAASVRNVTRADDRVLEIACPGNRLPARAMTPTFLTPDTIVVPPYGQAASPTLYAGQVVTALVGADDRPIRACLVVRVFTGDDTTRDVRSDARDVGAGEQTALELTVPDTDGQPVAAVGVEVSMLDPRPGTAHLDRLSWIGEPDVRLGRPADGGSMWRHAWVDAVDRFEPRWPEAYRLIHDRGVGLLIQGSRDWRDVEVTADIEVRHGRIGLAARVQGMRRYYEIRLADRARRVELARIVDDTDTVLATASFPGELYGTYTFRISVEGDEVTAAVEDTELHALDRGSPLHCGAVALVVTEGHLATECIRVRPTRSARSERKGQAR